MEPALKGRRRLLRPFRANSLALPDPGLTPWALLLHPFGVQAPDSKGLEIVPVFLNQVPFDTGPDVHPKSRQMVRQYGGTRAC